MDAVSLSGLSGVEHRILDDLDADDFLGLILQIHGNAADAASNDTADPVRILLAKIQSGIIHRQLGAGNRILDEQVHPLCLFLIHIIRRIEILDLRGNLAGEFRRIKPGDPVNAADAGLNILPNLFFSYTNRRNCPHTCYDNSLHK